MGVPMRDSARTCPTCRRGVLKSIRIDDEFDFRVDEGLVHVRAEGVPVEACDVCGEQLSGPEAAAIRHRAVCKTLGLLGPDEVRGVRERMGLTQAQFSKLTGIGEATISRWERGRLLQNRANDRYLRLLASGPEMVHLLEAMPGPSAPVTSS